MNNAREIMNVGGGGKDGYLQPSISKKGSQTALVSSHVARVSTAMHPLQS